MGTTSLPRLTDDGEVRRASAGELARPWPCPRGAAASSTLRLLRMPGETMGSLGSEQERHREKARENHQEIDKRVSGRERFVT